MTKKPKRELTIKIFFIRVCQKNYMLLTWLVISLQMNLDDDLGIAIAGGIDTPAIPNDSSIVITNVAKGSIADGKLR